MKNPNYIEKISSRRETSNHFKRRENRDCQKTSQHYHQQPIWNGKTILPWPSTRFHRGETWCHESADVNSAEREGETRCSLPGGTTVGEAMFLDHRSQPRRPPSSSSIGLLPAPRSLRRHDQPRCLRPHRHPSPPLTRNRDPDNVPQSSTPEEADLISPTTSRRAPQPSPQSRSHRIRHRAPPATTAAGAASGTRQPHGERTREKGTTGPPQWAPAGFITGARRRRAGALGGR